ncbi:MAG: type II toxin-antitoxin system RelE/ParE family toxin [Bacteroidota bacterium]
MQVVLSDYAKTQIKLIYAYYKETASIPVAKKVTGEIVASIEILKKFPQAGQVDEVMKKFGKEYRRIIS